METPAASNKQGSGVDQGRVSDAGSEAPWDTIRLRWKHSERLAPVDFGTARVDARGQPRFLVVIPQFAELDSKDGPGQLREFLHREEEVGTKARREIPVYQNFGVSDQIKGNRLIRHLGTATIVLGKEARAEDKLRVTMTFDPTTHKVVLNAYLNDRFCGEFKFFPLE